MSRVASTYYLFRRFRSGLILALLLITPLSVSLAARYDINQVTTQDCATIGGSLTPPYQFCTDAGDTVIPLAVNQVGEVVGRYHDADLGVISYINDSAAIWRPQDINAASWVFDGFILDRDCSVNSEFDFLAPTRDPDTTPPLNCDTFTFVATDINDSNTADARIIVGYLIDGNGNEQAVFWKKAQGASDYSLHLLAPYKREITECKKFRDYDRYVEENSTECYNLNGAGDTIISPINGTDMDSPNPTQLASAPTDCFGENTDFSTRILDADSGNDQWVIECDPYSRAVGVNDSGYIIGVAYHFNGPDRVERPVYWAPIGENTANPYVAVDLGFEIPDANVSKITETYLEKEYEIYTTRTRRIYKGEPITISQTGSRISGYLRDFHTTSVSDKKVAILWSNVDKGGFLGPYIMGSGNSSNNYEFPGDAVAETVSPFGVGGRYFDSAVSSGPTIMAYWGGREERAPATSALGNLGGNNGAMLASNINEIVGHSEKADSSYTGSLFTQQCGLQNVNDLLTGTTVPPSPLLQAFEISSTVGENGFILARDGSDPVSNYGPLASDNVYVLRPAEHAIDLKIDLTSDHDKLTVGEPHTFRMTVSNLPTAAVTTNTYATCIYANLVSAVYLEFAPERSAQQEPGGMEFISARALSGNASCDVTEVSVDCYIARLDENQSISFEIKASPRPLLADRIVKTIAKVYSTEESLLSITPSGEPLADDKLNNTDENYLEVEREPCFIATAAYGSWFDPHVATLRAFRDRVLNPSPAGRQLVQWYYQLSPPIADMIRDNETFKSITRVLLTPVVYGLRYPVAAISMLLLLFSLVAWRAFRPGSKQSF